MQFNSIKDALDHLLSYAGQDGDEAAAYIMDEITRLREAFTVALQNQKEASADWLDAEFTITGLREKLAQAEHEIAVLNRMFIDCVNGNACPAECLMDCGSPECFALLREDAEKKLAQEEES